MSMTPLKVRLRPVHRIMAASVLAALAGGLVLTAAPAPVRLVGVSAQATGRAAAVMIEATEPVAYAVSRPDPLTVLVDLRNVSVEDAENQVSRSGPVSGVSLEQATAIDGKALARVRVALTSPANYRVRSARNVIRVELEPTNGPVPIDGTPAAVRRDVAAVPSEAAAAVVPATVIEKVHASHTRLATTITLAGDGRLNPASLTESDDQPRRLIMEFPNLGTKAPSQVNVDGAFVKKVRVAVSSREPVSTRVVVEMASNAAYHVEQAPADATSRSSSREGSPAAKSSLRRRRNPRRPRLPPTVKTRCRCRRPSRMRRRSHRRIRLPR
jgi:hypothetical protein